METEVVRIEFKRMSDEFASVTQDVTVPKGGLSLLYAAVSAACKQYQEERGIGGIDNVTPNAEAPPSE